ncbi:two component transcriptional regulator, LytTR family [Duganella sp. CF458]|uniref:LytR/AlgR family response regulator transcription factor n=1 Tax=Duganella sp. CF458 TaxID=1884368 RepID=UPI0008E44027|nr:LytTR family DNA-binding domain-containing protein [Duganella sp. CF458]SFG50573.1 two component transcriptional regulator, LytTR family [Duganella sp. CF458]
MARHDQATRMNVLIVEDEPLIAQRLVREVRLFFGERVAKISQGDDLDELLVTLRSGTIDLLLLDLNLHGDDGFRLLEMAREGSFRTVIVSAHAERAVRAFDFGVLDFVAKPFSQARLQQAFQRYADSAGQEGVRSLVIRKMGGIELLSIDKINHIRADGHYTQLQMCDGSGHFHDCALDKLLATLPPNFLRVHRSYAVNMQHFIRLRIAPGGRYLIDTRFTAGIPVSRGLYPSVRAALASF